MQNGIYTSLKGNAMKYLCLLLGFILGCTKTSCEPCCEICIDNMCKCDFVKENCICEAGSCTCRFHIDNVEYKKLDYLRKELPKVVITYDSSHSRKD